MAGIPPILLPYAHKIAFPGLAKSRLLQTHCIASVTQKNQFGPQSKNLASIIRGFKIEVTKNARLIHTDFAWQSRFHDHIIRNNAEYHRISTYIRNNPAHWQED